MGLRIFNPSGSSYPPSGPRYSSDSYDQPVVPTGSPDPKRYKIERTEQYGDFLIVKINYPDCSNYEGNKILVYRGIDHETLEAQQFIDPHFCEKKEWHSPVARFEPTERGLEYARIFASFMAGNHD